MALTPTTFSAAPWMMGSVQCFTSRGALLPPGALGSTQRKVKVSPRDWTRFLPPSFRFRMSGFNRLQFSCARKGRCARVRLALQPIFLHRENNSRVEVPLTISQFLQTGQYRINLVSAVIDSKQRTDSGVGLLRRLGGDPRVEPFQKLEQLTWEVHSTAPLGRGCRGISVYRVTEKGGEVPSGAEKRAPERVEFTISVSALLGDNWSRIVCWTSGCGKKAAEAWNFVMQSPSNRLPEPLENVGIEWLRANSHASMTMLNSQSKRRRACACAAMSRIIRRLAKLADAQTAAQKAAAENLHASAPTAG